MAHRFLLGALSLGGEQDIIFCPNEYQLLLNTKFDARRITPIHNTKASRNFGSYGSSQRFRNAQLIVIQTTAFSSSSTSSVRTGPGQRWLLASPHGDTTFNSWLRTNGRVFSGPWLANKTEKMARITWQKLELEISDLAMEDWGKAQEPG